MKMNHNKKISLTRALAVILLTLTCILCITPAFAATYPKPKDNVADEAGLLSESTIKSLKKANEALLNDTKTQIAICTVNTTGETDIADYARGVFKEWKLGDGVLLVIAKDDKDYYFVPSVGVENILTDEVLTEIRDTYLEEYFEDEGSINRGVNMCITKLSNTLTKGIIAAADDTSKEDGENKEEEKGTTAGGVIVGIFKAILYIVIAIVVIFVGFFVFAMFNDEAAELFQRYIFRRKQPYKMPEEYYDERLYGRPSANNRQNQNRLPQGRQQNRLPSGNPQQRRPQGYNNNQSRNGGYNSHGNYNRPQNQGYNRNSQGYRNPGQGHNQPQPRRQNNYYNADGTVRQPNRNQPRPQNNGQGYNNNGNETRAFTIPNRR